MRLWYSQKPTELTRARNCESLQPARVSSFVQLPGVLSLAASRLGGVAFLADSFAKIASMALRLVWASRSIRGGLVWASTSKLQRSEVALVRLQ